MSDRYAYILLRVTVIVGLVLALLSFAASAARAESTPAVQTDNAQPETPTSQSAGDVVPTSRPVLGREEGAPMLPTRPGSDTSGLLHQMLAMVVVIGLLGFAAWVMLRKVLPKIKTNGGGRKVRVLETTYLNPRQSVHLLQVGSKVLLVAGSKEGLTLLDDVTDGLNEKSDDFAATLAEQGGGKSTLKGAGE